ARPPRAARARAARALRIRAVDLRARRVRPRRPRPRYGLIGGSMPRPVTLFTGQWADLPLEDLAALAGGLGFDGLELACWGDHFEVDRALADEGYCRDRQEILERNHLNVFAIGAHLVGQCVCDPIDDRHRGILPPELRGDGDPEGVRQR